MPDAKNFQHIAVDAIEDQIRRALHDQVTRTRLKPGLADVREFA